MSARYFYLLPFGAEYLGNDRTCFRLWAPDCRQVELVIEGESPIAMQRGEQGMFEIETECGAGTAYYYRIDEERCVPDPASRQQSLDVHDPSLVCDPRAFRWQHDDWNGRPWHEIAIYELHAGCMGGFAEICQRLPDFVELGITAIQLMPIADFRGTRNWGYDGVLAFAPDTAYGTPDQLKHLIDTAHGYGLCVYLDVVYNHFGPEGNYLHLYASDFFCNDKHSPWGAAIDFSNPQVRDFFTLNALYWLLEYRFDGLRFDAVHQIGDSGWLEEMALQVRNAIEPGRHVHLILENEHNCSTHLESLFDAQWNDDGHNVLHVILTGERDGHYQDFSEAPAAKLARCLADGFIYQGEQSKRLNRTRGTPSAHLPPHAFILFLQNHDQIGNRAFGERLQTLAEADALRAAITLQLLVPQIPLLFMGEETGCRTPFLYFTNFEPELAAAVREGRRREFAALPAFADPVVREQIPDPNAIATFISSIPQIEDPEQSACYLLFYRTLLMLRRKHIVPGMPGCHSLGARELGEFAVAAQWRMGNGNLLVLVTNFGQHSQAIDSFLTKGELIADSRQLWNPHSAERDSNWLPGHTTRIYLQQRSLFT